MTFQERLLYISITMFLITYIGVIQIWVHAVNVRVDKIVREQQ